MTTHTTTAAHVIAVALFHLQDIDPDHTVAILTSAALALTGLGARIATAFA